MCCQISQNQTDMIDKQPNQQIPNTPNSQRHNNYCHQQHNIVQFNLSHTQHDQHLYRLHNMHCNWTIEQQKQSIILFTDTLAYLGTVVVKLLNTSITDGTMTSPWRPQYVASGALLKCSVAAPVEDGQVVQEG